MRCFPMHTCHSQTYAKAFSLSHFSVFPPVAEFPTMPLTSQIPSYLLPFSSLLTDGCGFTLFWVFFMHLSYETNIRDP